MAADLNWRIARVFHQHGCDATTSVRFDLSRCDEVFAWMHGLGLAAADWKVRPCKFSPDWIMNRNQLRTGGKSGLDLYVVNHLGHAVHNVFAFQDRSSERHDLRSRLNGVGSLQYFRRADSDRVRVVELQSA